MQPEIWYLFLRRICFTTIHNFWQKLLIDQEKCQKCNQIATCTTSLYYSTFEYLLIFFTGCGSINRRRDIRIFFCPFKRFRGRFGSHSTLPRYSFDEKGIFCPSSRSRSRRRLKHNWNNYKVLFINHVDQKLVKLSNNCQ